MSVTFMDSMSMFIVQTLGLQLMRCERPLLIRLSLTRLLFLLLPESLWAKSGKNKIKSQETPTNWTYYSDISILLGVLCSLRFR